MLDPAIPLEIDAQYPCRLPQLHQLAALIGNQSIPSPQSFLLHGLSSTGKSLILRALLERTSSRFSWIASNECITARQLTERVYNTVAAELGVEAGGVRCENTSVLAVELGRILREHAGKFFLVLDRIDQLREASGTLLPALRRLGEMIPNLTIIFIVSVPTFSFSAVEMPHIHFPAYNKEESIRILSLSPLRIKRFPTPTPSEAEDDEDDEEPDLEEELHVWQKFCGTVWDSLARGAARDLIQFRSAVVRSWYPFIQPIARGEYGTRNYASLYLRNKDMFRREDTVIDSVIPVTEHTVVTKSHDLPLYSRWLLCASYLASYNPPRLDAQFFMKASELKKKRRGGGGGVGKRAGKTRKISRRLLGAQAWPLERLMAIFHAITPADVASSVDLLAQVATLTSLRLLVKASTLDVLDGSAKWKVNVGWDYVRGVARSVKFDIEDRLAE